MEKILVVINAHKPDLSSIDFACRIAALAQSRLTGLFIENLYNEYVAEDPESSSYFKYSPKNNNGTAIVTDTGQAIKLFNEECRLKGVPSEVYIDKGEPIQEVVYESRFADLLLINPNISFYESKEQLPSHFVKEILVRSECPVLLTPNQQDEVEEIVFCYDGSASSVFAIKQFTYLLPQFGDKKALLLEVNHTGREEFDDNHRKLMHWLKSHYRTVYFHALQGNVKDELFAYFFMKRQKLVVMGAYGRSLLSKFFKKSSAERLIRMIDLPLFITHY